MKVISIILIIMSLSLLYLKYRIVFHGKRCRGKIIGIKSLSLGVSYRGVPVKKNAYIVEINHQKYYTSHGCLFIWWGKRKIGKDIDVYINEEYGREVVQLSDIRVEIFAFLLIIIAFVMCILD